MKHSELLGKFNTVFYLNALEHFPANSKAVANCKKLLRSGGYLILMLPVSTALYQESDEGFDEWRRINRKNIKQLLTIDLEILKTQFFKVLGHVGWYLSGKYLHTKINHLDKRGMYHEKVPLFLGVDEIVFHRTGLSAIVVAKKK